MKAVPCAQVQRLRERWESLRARPGSFPPAASAAGAAASTSLQRTAAGGDCLSAGRRQAAAAVAAGSMQGGVSVGGSARERALAALQAQKARQLGQGQLGQGQQPSARPAAGSSSCGQCMGAGPLNPALLQRGEAAAGLGGCSGSSSAARAPGGRGSSSAVAPGVTTVGRKVGCGSSSCEAEGCIADEMSTRLHFYWHGRGPTVGGPLLTQAAWHAGRRGEGSTGGWGWGKG